MEEYFEVWKKNIDKLIKEHPLHIISWEATRRCNQKCVHCGSPSESVSIIDELRTEEVIGAFDQIAKDFDMSQFKHINITGGEPFVRKDLFTILKHLKKYPFYQNIDIQTNGLILAEQPEYFDRLKKLGVTGLGISIDGLEKTHNAFRKTKDGFNKAFQAAELSVQHGYITTVSTVAHSKNVDELHDLFYLVKEKIKPRVFRVMTIDPIGRAEFDNEYLLSHNQVRKVIHFLKNEYEKNCHRYSYSDTTMVELGCGGWLGRDLEGKVRPLIFHCIAGINNLGILFDGKLASCSNISREFIEGDLRRDRIKDIWENCYQKYRSFDWKKKGACIECTEWEFCHGGPMHKRIISGQMFDCIYLDLNHLTKISY